MNPRIEKLCLPRHRRDAIWKFWQPNAKLEKIYPPIYWKNLDYKSIHIKKTIKVKESKKLHDENLCLNACNYTTLIYKPTSEKQFNEKGFHIFVDFEHNGLEHATWKESIEDSHFLNDKIKKNDESSIIEFSWSNLNHKKQIFNDQYLKRQELIRYIKNHIQKDNLFELDKNSYPNQPISISRRPRDTLHIDFYPAACFQGSKTEATFKTFYHRKYLLPQHLREHTLKDLITIANNIQLDIDIIGHFVLHPNELSKHEIKMFELTSEFGDIYEGHIIRINKEKLVLLLASTYHSNIKLVQSHDFKNIINDSTNFDIGINSQSRIEQIVIDHVREYLQINNDYSIEQIRRIQIELEPLMNKDKRRVIVHLITNDEIIENLTFEITREQEPKLFDNEYEKNLYFLQGINEEKIIQSVEHKLKELFTKRYFLIHEEENHNSYLQLTLDIEYDTLNSIKKMLYAYANHQLTTYSREECMRIGIEYSFDDLLDKLDSNELQSIDDKQIQMIIDDIQIRLRLQIERRFKAETTAKILLIGPPMKKETKSIGKEVNILNHHREIFINQLDTHTSSSKMKDIQRNHGNVILHEEIDGGPKSFDRLPMSIDSLTILTRIQQRKRLNVEENNNTLVSFESEIHPLMTFKDQKQTTSYSEQNNIEKNSLSHLYEPFLYDENDNNSIKTLNTISINTKSFNTSADTKQQYFIELHQTNQDEQQRKKKRMSRSSVEYGKHKQKRKKHKPYKSTSNIYINNMNSKHLFFNKLFLLYQNKKSKTMTLIKNHNRKQKHIQLPNAINVNTITETSNITTKIYSNDDITTIKNSISHHDNLFIKSNEDLSSFDELKQSNLLKSFEDEQLKINNSLPTIKIITDSISLESVQDNIEGQDLLNTRDHNIGLDEKISKLNDKDESTEYQQFQDEGFQDKEDMNDDSSIEDSEMSYDTERYLRSLYGSLSSTMKQVYEMYQSKSSRLRLTLDLAHTFINFLHIRKDIAYEIASTIIDARQRLVPSKLTQKSSSSTNIDENFLSNIYINEENDNDDTSISSGIITAEDSDTIVNENSKTSRSISDSRTKYNLDKKKIFYLSNSQRIMNRIITYLSEVDWRVFNYLTKHFLQNGTMITSHALEFSSALLIDLIEDSVYQTYFHSKWCSDSYIHLNDKNEIKYIENILIEEFFKKSIYYLFNRLQLINSPLLENIALMHTLKKYMSTNLLQEFTSLECHAIPLGLNPCIWFSSNILIKTICSLTDDILKQMNHDYLSDYTKFEYVLVSYFRKIQIVHNLQEIIETNQHLMKSKLSPTISNSKYLLHVIDLNQAPKFFSHKAFKRFQFGEHSHINDDIEALKDLVLLDIERHNIKSMKGPYIPLNINDLVIHQQNRVLTPSPWILAQYHQRSNIQKLSADECNLQEASYRYDETTDSIKTDNLPPEVRDLLDNMIRKYGTIEGNLGISTTRDLYEGLSEDVAQLIENAIEAVQTFDRENNIGDRKLQSRKTVNDRLTEFFKYAGRHGVRLLDDVLKLAKLRSHDPKKYIPLAVNMLKDRLNATGTTGLRKQAVRFAYTLETLLIATNDEPALIAAMLKKKTNEKKSLVFSERSDQSLTTELDSLKQITEEVDKKIDTSLIESVATTTIPSRSFKMFTTDKYQQILPTIDEAVESTMSFSGTTDIDREHYFEAIMSNAIMSHDGLTVAHLVVLVIGHNQEPLKLTNTQIEQIYLKQNLSTEKFQDYLQKLLETTVIPDKFELTEEQLVQIAIEENISITDIEYSEISQDNLHLNENQIRFLINQINLVNWMSSTLLLEQQQSWLVLQLDQLIQLCNQQMIDIDRILNNETVLQNSSLLDSSKIKFTLTSSQIAHLINQNNFNIRKLLDIEQNLKQQSIQAQQFRLNSSQLAYFFAHHRIVNNQRIVGLSVAQLIGIYTLQQRSNENDQSLLFSLDYQQIRQLALIQNMTLEHFHSLSTSNKPLQLTHNQLIHLAMENKISVKQIVSIRNEEKSKVFDQKQLCSLINQNSQANTIQKSVDLTQSIDKSFHIQQYVYLTVEQIFSLVKSSNIKLDELTTCTTEHINMIEFRFKPEQLATLWNINILTNDFEYTTSLPTSSSQFILNDEQFSSLLHSVSTSILSTQYKSTIMTKSNLKSISPSVPILPYSLFPSNKFINIIAGSTDIQNQLYSSLTDQLTAMHERLKSSIQTHIETVEIVSNSILKHNRIENTLNLVHQLSLHSIDDISTKEVETIPSFILDLLKINIITENIYKSIKYGEITSDILDKPDELATKSKEIIDFIASDNLNKTIIEGIQTYRLSFSQIYKIQTQLITPKLIEEFKSGHLSKRILDAYKSQSPLQIINKVRSSLTQLNKLLLQQSSSSISQFDPTIVPIVQQTVTQNNITTNNVFEVVDKLSRTTQQNPIIIYPKSPILRKEILQELRDRLDSQLLELNKEYGIEPIKGKASIRQITDKLRTMAIIQELETLIGRQIDEVDILNILEGNISYILDEIQIDSKQINILFHRNIQQRLNRINERIQLVNILQNDIEIKRLKRPMNLEELTALIFEDISKFEKLTNLYLTEIDLRIISMNRFSSLEQSLNRQLTEFEYRYLLQNNLSYDYIEQKLLQRSLTIEERIEQEELTLQSYQQLFPNNNISILSQNFIDILEQENIKLTHKQLEQILQYRAQLIDQYDIIHSISSLIKNIEKQLNRLLTIDEKKRLIHDDYSMIEYNKNLKYNNNINEKIQEILPITASLLKLIENTQDKNLLENIKYLENNIGRSLTKQEIIMVANGDIISLEKLFNKSLSTETIKSIYKNRFIDLKNELNRNLTDKEIRDILNGKLSGIEKALGRQLTSTERLTYKPVNIIDLTASQLTHNPSIDRTIQELEDVLERRLTLDEIQYLTDQQKNLVKVDLKKKLSSNQLDMNEVPKINLMDLEEEEDESNEDLFIFDRILKQRIYFTLSEIEKAIGNNLNSDELERFASLHFTQIEHDLGKPLNDLQRSNLLNGDKLTIESLIGRQLSSKETGPHIVDITNIERILNRSLTLDELTNLAGDRFDEIRTILQRSFKQDELIDLLNGHYRKIIKLIEEQLNKQKEDELQELPINRIRYFENILHRKLSPHELLRFAEIRFEPLSRLLSSEMKSEQILDLASGYYDKIEKFFNRSLTIKEKNNLKKSILKANIKYLNPLDELEYIIQRRLNEQELRIYINNQYNDIEIRLGKLLTEKQIRNILHEEYDTSLIEVKDIINYLKRKSYDNYKRTQFIYNKLIKKIDQDYIESPKESLIIKTLRPYNVSSTVQQKQSDIEFHQSTIELLEQLSDDVRKHKIIQREDSLIGSPISEIFHHKSISSDDELKNEQQSLSYKEPISTSSSSSHELIISLVHEIQPNKAFENITRIVESIADKEHIEEMTTVTNAIDKFQVKILPNVVDKPSDRQTVSTWLSSLNQDTTFSYLPTIKPIDNKLINREISSPQIHIDDDLYLGWTLFKSIDRPDLGLKEEKPRIINVKHLAQTFVVGIPEEYADNKTKAIANKIYQGKSILPRLPKSRIIKEMTEFVSQLFHMPIINDATHFIVPSRTYNDIIESMDIYESEITHIEDNELQMRDSPETLEWYEECIQRNVQIHAQIPTEYQPSIVYCHTGRQSIITPAKRAEQRKMSMGGVIEKSKVILEQPETKVPEDVSTFNSSFIERLSQPLLDFQSIEPASTSRTVTDLIMHTVTTSQKTNLLEALEELFSQENLDTYQISENHWQDIFLILLNSYLRSHSLNRKEIFQRLTEKLHDLRKQERRRSSDFYPSISVLSLPIDETINISNESDIIESKQTNFYFGLQSSFDSTNSSQSPNNSENKSLLTLTTDQQSTNSQEKRLLSTNNNHLIQSFVPKSKIISDTLSHKKSFHLQSNMDNVINTVSVKHINQNLSINSNAINKHQCSSTSIKNRRYKITVMHSDELFDIPSNQCKTLTESTKLPPIVPKKQSFQTKQTTSKINQLPSSSSITTKQIRKNIFSDFRNK